MLILVEHHHNAAWGGADAFPTIIMMKQLKSCMFVIMLPSFPFGFAYYELFNLTLRINLHSLLQLFLIICTISFLFFHLALQLLINSLASDMEHIVMLQVHFAIPLQFPKQQPALILQSSQVTIWLLTNKSYL
jgi:hypothetical protein